MGIERKTPKAVSKTPLSVDEIIKLRITWLVTFVLVMATLAPFLMLYGDQGDPNRVARAEMLYNLIFLLVGYLIGGKEGRLSKLK
jgi:hypothetical protein